MGMTMTQKILAEHAGLESVSAGQLISADLDMVLANDITGPVSIKEFDKAGFGEVFDKSKISLVMDHFVPNKDIKSAEQCKTCAMADKETIYVTDVGQHQMWSAQFLGDHNTYKFITSGGLGTMGFGYGAAIGAQIGNPDKRVIHITGDGSFHMCLNEACRSMMLRSGLSKWEIMVSD